MPLQCFNPDPASPFSGPCTQERSVEVATPNPRDPIAKGIIAHLVPSGKKMDWAGFVGFGGGFDGLFRIISPCARKPIWSTITCLTTC
jgi:hypothetical protein